MSETRIIPLSAIVGRSRYNVRPDGDEAGKPAMAASIRARGLITALLVREADHPDLYEVDDGGCRWDAMRLLVEQDAETPPDDRDPWHWNSPVKVEIVNGDAVEARSRSLAANVVRRQMHPVEECEAFAAMVAEGVSTGTIAADFGTTPRYVRQRLKLDELSPRVRKAWRDGSLPTEAAEVLTGAPDHATQDEILDRHPGPWPEWRIREIRHLLRQDAMLSSEALYVGLDAYVVAGGLFDEQQFDAGAHGDRRRPSGAPGQWIDGDQADGKTSRRRRRLRLSKRAVKGRFCGQARSQTVQQNQMAGGPGPPAKVVGK